MPEGNHRDGDVVRTHDYLAKHGEALLDNGYHIVPIRVGGKAPGFDGWEKSRATKAQLGTWLSNGHAHSGVGVLTARTPVIDLDIRDEEVAALMEAWCQRKFGASIVRIGMAPKRAIVFRTDKPFSKKQSAVWIDPEWMQEHKVEVLAEGQECVLYHVHPDTGKPYTWAGEPSANPLKTLEWELPTLDEDQAQAVVDEFNRLATERGWTTKSGRGAALKQDGIARGLPESEDTRPVTDLTDNQIGELLMLVPGVDEYDRWVQIGMALHHQFKGSKKGLAAWHTWSKQSDKYDAEALDKKWADFAIEGKRRAPITAHAIVKWGMEAKAKRAVEQVNKLFKAFKDAVTKDAWNTTRDETRTTEMEPLDREGLVVAAKKSREAIDERVINITVIRKEIAYRPKDRQDKPDWLEPWVFDKKNNTFFNINTKLAIGREAFDGAYDRKALTLADTQAGRAMPSLHASDLARNVHKITVVDGQVYAPGRDDIFYEGTGNNTRAYANSYNEADLATIPKELSAKDKLNVQRMLDHVAHQIADETERNLFIEALAWMAQHPGKHMNYAVVLQGTQGDGKSYWGNVFSAMLGESNATTIDATKVKGTFNPTSKGKRVVCIDEAEPDSRNRNELLDIIKDWITGRTVAVNEKNVKLEIVRNVTNYILFTNHKDALPIGVDARRFLVFCSRWQRKMDLDSFNEENPDYYTNLHATYEESPGALLAYFMNRKISPEFNPYGNAPATSGRSEMVALNKKPFVAALDEIIEQDDNLDASVQLVCLTLLTTYHEGQRPVISNAPSTNTMNKYMTEDGYVFLGKFRLDGIYCRCWSKYPELFKTDGEIDPEKIRTYRHERKTTLATKAEKQKVINAKLDKEDGVNNGFEDLTDL